jgi:diguanylate cyclase (GGDEF)-like protein
MPEMDGFELAEKIRGKAEYAKTPVIFLTGNPSRDRTLRAMELGAKDFIIKPVSHEVLLSKVGKYLNTVGLVEHYQQMLARYERDELTGLNGANKFRDFVKGIERRSASTGVVFFDVNDLKKYNDNVGHHAGDLLLKKAAESIEMVAGGNVHGFRTGGDEFVVVITDCTETDIAMFMKNWHNKLKELNTKDDGITCVMAAGAAFGTGNYEMDKVMKTADERMYADKKRIKAAKGEVPR